MLHVCMLAFSSVEKHYVRECIRQPSARPKHISSTSRTAIFPTPPVRIGLGFRVTHEDERKFYMRRD